MTMWRDFKRTGCALLLAGLLPVTGIANAQVVSVSANPNPAVVGVPLTLDVLIAGVTDLYGYQFSLAFNPLVLQATGSSEGAFLPAAGATLFGGGVIDNGAGTVTLAFGTLTGPVPGASGAGVLTSLNFNVIAAGTSALTFSEVILLNSNLELLPVQLSNGLLTAVPEPASYALFALGLAGVAALRQRRAG